MLDRLYTEKRAPCTDGAPQREMDDGFPSLFYSFSRPLCLIKLPNLDIHWNKVRVRSDVLYSGMLMYLKREDLITAVINLARILTTSGRFVLSFRGSQGRNEREEDRRLFTAIPAGRLVRLLESAGFRVVALASG